MAHHASNLAASWHRTVSADHKLIFTGTARGQNFSLIANGYIIIQIFPKIFVRGRWNFTDLRRRPGNIFSTTSPNSCKSVTLNVTGSTAWAWSASAGAQWIESMGEVGQNLDTLKAYNSVHTQFWDSISGPIGFLVKFSSRSTPRNLKCDEINIKICSFNQKFCIRPLYLTRSV